MKLLLDSQVTPRLLAGQLEILRQRFQTEITRRRWLRENDLPATHGWPRQCLLRRHRWRRETGDRGGVRPEEWRRRVSRRHKARAWIRIELRWRHRRRIRAYRNGPRPVRRRRTIGWKHELVWI